LGLPEASTVALTLPLNAAECPKLSFADVAGDKVFFFGNFVSALFKIGHRLEQKGSNAGAKGVTRSGKSAGVKVV
jgi:hypothetical protein